MIGAYGFDPDRVPRDEFQIRMAALNGVMDRKGLKAMLIYGDACEHSALAYFTSFIPRHRWALALLPRAGDARLLVSMSSRDMPAQRLMTWIPEVMTAWTWDQGFDQWLASLGADAAADIGTLRFDLMRPVLREQIEKSTGNRFRLIAADPDVAALRTTRPRELSLARDACEVVRASAEAFAQAWRAGEGAETAALAGERTARRLAAQNVRTLRFEWTEPYRLTRHAPHTLAPWRPDAQKGNRDQRPIREPGNLVSRWSWTETGSALTKTT